MQGTPGPDPADAAARATPPDWPAPDAPLPWDEPTQELPVIQPGDRTAPARAAPAPGRRWLADHAAGGGRSGRADRRTYRPVMTGCGHDNR